MAVSMSATLALNTGNAAIVMGQRFTCTLTIKESGGTATNILSIQPFLLNSDGTKVCQNGRFGTVANSQTIASYSGAAMTVNSSSMIFNFDCVVDGPVQWGQSAAANATYQIGVACVTSDGSVFGPSPVVVCAALPESGLAGTSSPAPNGLLNQSVIFGTTTNQYGNVTSPGALRFDISTNLVSGLLLGFP